MSRQLNNPLKILSKLHRNRRAPVKIQICQKMKLTWQRKREGVQANSRRQKILAGQNYKIITVYNCPRSLPSHSWNRMPQTNHSKIKANPFQFSTKIFRRHPRRYRNRRKWRNKSYSSSRCHKSASFRTITTLKAVKNRNRLKSMRIAQEQERVSEQVWPPAWATN